MLAKDNQIDVINKKISNIYKYRMLVKHVTHGNHEGLRVDPDSEAFYVTACDDSFISQQFLDNHIAKKHRTSITARSAQ